VLSCNYELGSRTADLNLFGSTGSLLPNAAAACTNLRMLGKHWESQWWRVQTRLTQVRAVYAGRDCDTNEAWDSVLSFFEAIHHLADWLHHDQAVELSQSDVKKFVRQSPMLSLCGDLANGSKHMVLTSSLTKDLSTRITRNDATILVGHGTLAHAFYVQSHKVEYDALEIAEAAVEEWTSFLITKGLL
jgi:hypothetical protein